MQLLENLKLTYVASIKFLLYNAVLNNGMYNEESVKIDLRETAASSPRLPVSFLFVCLFCFTLDSISFGGRWHFNYIPNRSQARWLQESAIRFWLLVALLANTIEKE